MNNVTPESLKKVAEYMGKPSVRILENGEVVYREAYVSWWREETYNPPQNSDQDSEIEIKLKPKTRWLKKYNKWSAIIDKEFHAGDTPAEARLNAVIAYVEAL